MRYLPRRAPAGVRLPAWRLLPQLRGAAHGDGAAWLVDQVLDGVYHVIAAHLIKQAGYTQQSARTGAVTLIRRLGSALNLNVHFHMLFLGGVYERAPDCWSAKVCLSVIPNSSLQSAIP